MPAHVDHNEVPLPKTIFVTTPLNQVYNQSIYGIPHAFFCTTTYKVGENQTRPPMSIFPRGGVTGQQYLRVWTTPEECPYFNEANYYYLHTAGHSWVKQRYFLCRPKGMPPLVSTDKDGKFEVLKGVDRDHVFNMYDGSKTFSNIAVPVDVDVSAPCWQWDCARCESNAETVGTHDVQSAGPHFREFNEKVGEVAESQFIYHVTNIPCPTCAPKAFAEYKSIGKQHILDILTARRAELATRDRALADAVERLSGLGASPSH